MAFTCIIAGELNFCNTKDFLIKIYIFLQLKKKLNYSWHTVLVSGTQHSDSDTCVPWDVPAVTSLVTSRHCAGLLDITGRMLCVVHKNLRFH